MISKHHTAEKPFPFCPPPGTIQAGATPPPPARGSPKYFRKKEGGGGNMEETSEKSADSREGSKGRKGSGQGGRVKLYTPLFLLIDMIWK